MGGLYRRTLGINTDKTIDEHIKQRAHMVINMLLLKPLTFNGIPMFYPKSTLMQFMLFLLGVAIVFTSFWAFYHWWKKDKYTRDKFAFYGLSSLLGLGFFFVGSIFSSSSILYNLTRAFVAPLGVNIPPSSPSSAETFAITIIYVFLCRTYLDIFKSWDGLKSTAQHEDEKNNIEASVLRDVLLFSRLTKHSKEMLLPYTKKELHAEPVFENNATSAWHIRAKKLWLLKNKGFHYDENYNQEYKCWIGSDHNTGFVSILSCHHHKPEVDFLEKLEKYSKDVMKHKNADSYEIVIILKGNSVIDNKNTKIKYTNEEELLSELIDFSDYFSEIIYRVERESLIDSTLTISSLYTPSSFSFKERGATQGINIEEYLSQWLFDNNSPQVALMGDYGLGKSTASLMLTYNLIKNKDNASRIPILIELRGQSLRTMTKEEILAVWSSRYGIDSRALLQLHIAGQLLMIFEGFDEIELSGDTEARMSHFRSIWKLNYEKSKIIITGRRNFFRNRNELYRAFGQKNDTSLLYLSAFNDEQIKKSLSCFPKNVQSEIIELSEKDSKFKEVISRPSLLYIVAILWFKENLSKLDSISSAKVIDIFIKQTLKRQQDKHDERAFMILNSAERHYFMMGIASYMASKSSPNQIDSGSLDKAVELLVESIPESVSNMVSTVSGEVSFPLRSNERLDWAEKKDDILHKIKNDVRSCGLLISDLSKDNNFKFSHKSYMELLQAQAFGFYMSNDKDKQSIGQSLVNKLELDIKKLASFDESICFLAELLKEEYNNNDDIKLAKNLHDSILFWNSSQNNIIKMYTLRLFVKLELTLANIVLKLICYNPENSQSFGDKLLKKNGITRLIFISRIAISPMTLLAPIFLLFYNELVENTVGSMTALEISLLISIVLFVLIIDTMRSLTTDKIFCRLELWYRACDAISIEEINMSKVVGTRIVRLLKMRHNSL
ncbi:hypothetical protein AB4615_00590 [Vibrio splendidus]